MMNKHIVSPFKKDFGKKLAEQQRRKEGFKVARTKKKRGRV